MFDLIAERIQTIRADLPATVKLIGVTKQVSAEVVRLAYQAGLRDFGENRVQEAIAKQEALADLPDITWHLIGHLQTNKAHKAVANFPWIHGVDSLKLAEKIDEAAEILGKKPQVCLQVKILPDDQKFGWYATELMADLPRLNELKHISIEGLMTILPLGLTDLECLDTFQKTRQLAIAIQEQNWSNISMNELSMGMSQDYRWAVEAGATMIRLGTILFGSR
jgi:pyridoxal phosphate enzyme (YggS family)